MDDAHPATLAHRLRAAFDDLSDAERKIANFILMEPASVPYETADSLARRLRVSPITVGRFCRKFGFRNFRDLKARTKFETPGLPWANPEQFDKLAQGGGAAALRDDLQVVTAGIAAAYRLAAGAQWDGIVDLLAHSRQLLVAGFQTERGIALHFANLLQYARPGVTMLDPGSGSYLELLAETGEGRCLVVVETRRYSVHARRLAEQAAAAGVAVVIVTDSYCDWGPAVTPHILAVPTDSALFWTTMVPLVAVLTLLADAVVLRLGPEVVTPRLDLISGLYQDFVGHIGVTRP